MLIRPARPEDNEALCALSLGSPMAGEIVVAIDRSPNFFAFYDLFGENGCGRPPEWHYAKEGGSYFSLVTVDEEAGGKVVGVMMIAKTTLLFEDRPITVARPEDGRVHPDYRRRGIARNQAVRFFEMFPNSRYDIATAYIIRGNKKAEAAIADAPDPIMIGAHLIDVHMTHLSLYKPYKEDKSLDLRAATPEDKNEIVNLLAEHYARYNFSPVVTNESWDRMLRSSLGYGYEHIHLLRDSGRLVGVVGLWDDFAVRRYVMIEWPAKVKLAMFLARVIGMFMAAPAPPRLGVPMRSLFLKHFACRQGFESALQSALMILTNRVRRAKGHHSVWGSFAFNDPLYGLLDPFMKSDSVSRMYVMPGNSGFDFDLDRMRARPIFADFTMV